MKKLALIGIVATGFLLWGLNHVQSKNFHAKIEINKTEQNDHSGASIMGSVDLPTIFDAIIRSL